MPNYWDCDRKFFSLSMFLKKFNFLSWNVRGLGDDEKCLVVRNTIKSSRCEICVLQETKCNRLDFSYIMRFLPSFFSYEVAFNLAINSVGGTIIAWKRSFTPISSWSTPHTVTVLLQQINSGSLIMVTNAYGPSDDSLKPAFIRELRFAASQASVPWVLAGDFNLVRWLVDRSACQRSFRLMELFNEFVADTGLIDVPLRNRTYTWSSNRPQPVFSKIDRVFLTPDWSTAYPVITLEALGVLASDHTPLVLSCKGLQQRPRRFQLESFWFKYQEPKEMVHRLWEENSSAPFNPIRSFHQRTRILHKGLSLWHSEKFGAMEKQLELCRKALLFFDTIEEQRQLVQHEFCMRIKI